ncbi:putative glycolipid-binding domain-containing protein [Prosthecomicrobium sp. N25]|uniref:putative glycolipid-binding domain-containing protein n=1 Tax=Prosthecomicrobium sp. N25 TaxID=3129254 RepID=UPI00307739AF
MTDQTRAVRWRSPDGGLEHLSLKIAETGVTAEGVVIGGAGETAFGLRYRIVFDAGWAAVRSLHLTVLGGPTLALRHDGYGEWSDQEGRKRKEFSGLLDIDVAAIPLGFVATVARQAWKAGKTQDAEVLRIAVPSLEPTRARLRIACREAGRAYELDGAPVTLGEDGLVTAWAGRCERIEA